MLANGNKMAAIRYARENFPRFVAGQEREVQALMGAVMYAGPELANSPYAQLLEPTHWAEAEDMFMRDACALMGLSIESPLGQYRYRNCSQGGITSGVITVYGCQLLFTRGALLAPKFSIKESSGQQGYWY
jgi:CTLH/CRA C-terminal to LisH motif domain